MDAIIVRRNPRTLTVFQPMSLFEEIDEFASDIWDRWTPLYHIHRSSIPMDMYSLKDEVVVRAELPGFRKEDIDISLEDGQLTVKGTKKLNEMPEDAEGHLCELCSGEYSRSVTLPYAVDSDKISANFENGLLEVKLPKTEESKPKHIEIKVK